MAFAEYRFYDNLGIVKHIRSYNADRPTSRTFISVLNGDRNDHISVKEWRALTQNPGQKLNGFLRRIKF